MPLYHYQQRFQSLKDRLARSKGFLDEKGLSSFIETLERGIIAESDLNIQKPLGNGSYGIVHEALCLEIPVAVKEFFYTEDFDTEYKLCMELMGINSSHIVQILGHSVKSSGRKALVMEVMDMDLRRLIEIKKESNPTTPFSVYEATDIMLQVASGLRELHRNDVIHRDIKPSNILVSIRKDGSFVVKLADFGASKTNFQTQYTYTDHGGTVMYMAPEMENEREKYTRTVDAYSFGVVYVQILTGSVSKEKLKKHKLPSLLEGIPSGLSKIICGCLEQEAKKRPSFKDICNDLWDVRERLLMAETGQHYLHEKTKLRRQFGKILNLLPKLPHWKAVQHEVADLGCPETPDPGQQSEDYLNSMANKSAGGFDLEDLIRSSAELIGKDRFGSIYRARLDDGCELTLRRLFKFNPRNISDVKEFKRKIESIRKLNHPNIVKLIEYFISKDEQIVYDYVDMPNGSLYSLLHICRLKRPDWETSLKIALDCTHGLSYIHNEYGAHGYIKSSSVFLDKNGNACIFDLGMAVAFPPAISTPEQDVYNFGVLLLEILTGRNQDIGLPTWDIDLPTWVQSMIKKGWTTKIFDVRFSDTIFDVQKFKYDFREDMLQIALDCVNDALERRPKMSLVVQMMVDFM